MLESEAFTLDAALQPEELVLRLERDALDWQESRLSELAQAAGMYGFAFRRDGNAFRVRPQINNRGLYSPTYEGVVLPREAGSRISGRFRFGRVGLTVWGLLLAGATAMIVFAATAFAREVPTAGMPVVVGVTAGLLALSACWVRVLLRYAWRTGELAREETRALLLRASAAAAPAPKPSNRPLERPGTGAHLGVTPGSAGRSAPSR